tara:strand:+ start:137 stop:475 length:339 start_codon:yes stop_codon:yes gene_type:complete
MSQKRKNRKGVMYSTDPNFKYEYGENKLETIPNKDQMLKIYIDKYRSGKIAIIIKEFVGTTDDLKNLGKVLKTKCGVGGSVKNGELIIQGNIREKLIEILDKEGYRYKRIGI